MKADSLRILTYTNMFPNYMQPNRGIYVKNRMRAFVENTQCRLDAIAPLPYFPKIPWKTRWTLFSQIRAEEEQEGIYVYHPRYFVLPKVGMYMHGQSLYWATHKLVRRLHQEKCYDLIDAHWIYPDGWAAVKIAQKLKLPVTLSARGSDINGFIDMPTIRPLIVWCLKNCDHIISVSQALKDRMLSIGIPKSKITVVGNGVDIKRFSPLPKEEARQKLMLPLNKSILLSVGRLDLNKGHHILIRTLKMIKEQEINIPRLYIIGSGELHDYLQKMVFTFGLEKDVTLVGEIPHQELRTWYSAADVFCLASEKEGWPNVLLEAIACGTPVVASNVSGIPEVVSSTDIGLLVEQRTPRAFVIQICKALQKSWDLKRLVEFSRQHTWDKTAWAIHEVFLKVLRGRNIGLSRSFLG